MHCIKTMKMLFLIALALIIAACAGTSKKSEKEQPLETAEGEVVEEAPFVPIPNPYLQSKKNVPEQAKQEFTLAKQAMAAKKWDEAETILTLMIETFPKLSGPYVNLGIVHVKKNNLEEAERALKFAIETNPHNFDAYDHLGVVYREQGKFKEAEENYLSALKLWPHHFSSNKNIGVLYDLYMGRFDEALKYYELAQKIAGGEDRQLKGWIIDLKRRMAAK